MSELKPCPCGATPTDIAISPSASSAKYANVSGECCGEWEIEFRTVYYNLDSEETKSEAIKAWNQAPRASDKEEANK